MSRRPPILLGTTIALGLALATCDGEPDPTDASVDASEPTDGGGIADTGPPDAARDSGSGPEDGGPPPEVEWMRMPGLLEGCDLAQAVDPPDIFGLERTACPSGAGCELLQSTNPSFEVLTPSTVALPPRWPEQPIYVVGGSAYRTSSPYRGATLIWPLGGSPIFAARGETFSDSDTCTLWHVGIGDGHFGMAVEYLFPSEPYPNGAQLQLWYGSLEDIGQLEPMFTVDETLAPPAGGVRRIAVSDTTFAANMIGGYTLVFEEGHPPVTRGGQYWTDEGAATGRVGSISSLIGRRLLWGFHNSAEDIEGIATAANLDAPAVVLYNETRPEYDLIYFHTDGRHMVWLEVSDRGETAELHASPYAETPAEMAPRLVAHLPRQNPPRLGSGMVAFRFPSPERLVLLDLESDRRYRFGSPDGWGFANEAVHVTGDFVLAQVGRIVAGQTQRGLMKIPLEAFDELGPGDPI